MKSILKSKERSKTIRMERKCKSLEGAERHMMKESLKDKRGRVY